MLTSNFDAAKAALLRDIAAGNDLSPKGCIDAPILDLVQCINGLPDYCTTSSCSGRISCYINAGLSKGIHWLLVRHGIVDVHSVMSSLGPTITAKDAASDKTGSQDGLQRSNETIDDAPEDLTVFKCEGALMHILCRDAVSARRLHAIAMTCGFRESGISLTPKKVMLAIRSTAFSLEFPIASRGELIIGSRALAVGVREANRRILANFARSDRLLAAIKDEFHWPVFKEAPLFTSDGKAMIDDQSQHMLSRWGHVAARCGEPTQQLIAVAGGFGYVDATRSRADRKLPIRIMSIGRSGPAIIESYEQMPQLSSVDSASSPEWDALKCMHAAIASDSRFIVIHGGRSSPLDAIGTTTIFERRNFQLVAQLDSLGAGAPEPRWGHTLTCIGDATFLLVGGRTPSGLAKDAFVLEYKRASSAYGALSTGAWRWSRVLVNSGAKDEDDSIRGVALSRLFHSACALNPDLSGFRHRLFPVKDTQKSGVDRNSNPNGDIEQQNLDDGMYSAFDSDRYSGVLVHGGITNMETSETDGKFYLVEVQRSLASADCFESKVTQLSCADNVFPTRFGHVLVNIGCKCVAIIGGATFAPDHDFSFGESCNHISSSFEGVDKPPSSTGDKIGATTQQLLVFDWSFDDAGKVQLKQRRSTFFSSDMIASDASNSVPYLCSIEAECRVHHQCVSLRDALGFNNDLVLLGGGMLCVGFSPHFCSPIVLRVTHDGARTIDAHNSEQVTGQDETANDRLNEVRIEGASNSTSKLQFGLTILAPKKSVKTVKLILEDYHLLDKSRRISSFAHDGATIERLVVIPSSEAVAQDDALSVAGPLMAIPVVAAFVTQSRGDTPSAAALNIAEELLSSWPASKGVIFMAMQKTLVSKLDIVSSQRKAFDFLANVCSQYRLDKADLPKKFEIVGDVLMISEGALPESKGWSDSKVPHLWRDLASCFDLTRVARHARVDSGPKRESRVQLLLPRQRDSDAESLTARLPDRPGWVVVNENGIRFGFDILKVMFCSGNVTERMRMARVQAKGEVVVDLYCGVGYYTLPFLVYAGAKYLHAFEWNPNSVASLLVNLAAAKVSPDRCMVHYGNNVESVFGVRDNEVRAATLRQSPPLFNMTSLVGTSTYTVRSSAAEPPGDWSSRLRSIADRVCLGLLPSSRGGWEAACHVLKTTGGTLHVHYNVVESDIPNWVEECAKTFSDLFVAAGKPMLVAVVHVERVKSYAPKVLHIVVDLKCTPRSDARNEG